MLTMEHRTQAVLASDKLSLCLMANPNSDCVAMLHRMMVLECIGQTMVVSNAFPRLHPKLLFIRVIPLVRSSADATECIR
jgi:hypothetical protein